MIKNFKQNLVDFRGNTLVEEDAKGNKTPFSLDIIAINSLLATDEADLKLSGVDKVKRFTLAQKIYSNPEKVELTKEEIQLIKDQIAKYTTILVTGIAWEMLDKEE